MTVSRRRHGRIVVCTYQAVPAAVRSYKPDRMISVLGPADRLGWPSFIDPRRHLKLCFDDVQIPSRDFTMPTSAHVRGFLDFLGQGDPAETLLVHCKAATSRSPAIALLTLASWLPGKEDLIAVRLRKIMPHARPSQVIVRLGDQLLGAGGRLEEAVRTLPVPDRISEGDIFEASLEEMSRD